jgi:hypothetical protein
VERRRKLERGSLALDEERGGIGTVPFPLLPSTSRRRPPPSSPPASLDLAGHPALHRPSPPPVAHPIRQPLLPSAGPSPSAPSAPHRTDRHRRRRPLRCSPKIRHASKAACWATQLRRPLRSSGTAPCSSPRRRTSSSIPWLHQQDHLPLHPKRPKNEADGDDLSSGREERVGWLERA